MKRFECDKCHKAEMDDAKLMVFCLTHNSFSSSYERGDHKDCDVKDLCHDCVFGIDGVIQIRQATLERMAVLVQDWFYERNNMPPYDVAKIIKESGDKK
jgi:hypothetical protein